MERLTRNGALLSALQVDGKWLNIRTGELQEGLTEACVTTETVAYKRWVRLGGTLHSIRATEERCEAE